MNETCLSIARIDFDKDPRVTIVCEDGKVWINNNQQTKFDLIFADVWPGKYEKAEETFNLLKKGGLYRVDDMSPQPNWPAGHEENVKRLLSWLDIRTDVKLTKMNSATGIVMVAKIK
jgi:spermidine synthase